MTELMKGVKILLRLDRFIANQTELSRNEVKILLRKGAVTLNGSVVRSADGKINPETDTVTLSGTKIEYNRYVYIMMNKPKGVLSVTEDTRQTTAVDLLDEYLQKRNVFPAGRLDKDSTGFLLLTDDGDFAHTLMHPKSHVDKTYIVQTDFVPQGAEEAFAEGVTLADGDECLSARYTQLSTEPPLAEIIIHEGKYHQIKRMLGTLGVGVNELRRIKIGNLPLDEALAEGEYRLITPNELKMIRGE